ncbi:tape measure protein [Mycobacterium phage Danforth]|nr:tape measure protein [Mycobacterium phage Danforth]
MAEAGPGGREVGRISVRVVPDSTGFRSKMQKQLEAETAGLDAEADLKLGDTAEFRAKAKAATEGLEADVSLNANTKNFDRIQKRMLGNAQTAMNKLAAKASFTPDGERMYRQSEKAFKALEKDIKADIPINIHLAAGQRAKVAGEIQALQALADANPLEIKLKVDDEKTYKLMQAGSKARNKLTEQEAKQDQAHTTRLAAFHKQLYENKHRQRIADFKEELRMMKMREDETQKFVKQYRKDNPPIQLKLDDKFDYRLRQRLSKLKAKVEVEPIVKKSLLEKAFGSVKMPSFGTGLNFSGYAVAFAAIMAVLAPLVGLLTTALLSLPGLISLVAAPIAAITLGLDGMKKAAEKVKPQFDHLRQVMSDVAETEFTPVLERVANTVFPMLERSLPSVTAGLRQLADGALDAINNPNNKLEETIRNIGGALTAAKPGVDGFVSGFLQLANALSEKLPGITDWFNNAGTAFDNWVAKITAGGDGSSLSKAFDGLGDSLRIILELLGDLAVKGVEFMNDPQKIHNFNQALKDVAETIKGLMEISSGFVKTWNGIGEVIGWITNPAGKVGQLLSDEKPDTSSFEVALKNMEAQASESGAASGQAFTEAMQQALTSGPAMTPTSPTGEGWKDMLLGATGGPPPEIPPPNTEPAKAKMSEYQGFVDQVTAQVRGSLQQATSGESLPAPNFEAFKAAWTGLVTFVSEQGTAMKTAATEIGNGLGLAMSGSIESIKTLVASVPASTAPHWEALKQQAITAFNGIATEAAALPGKIAESLSGLAGTGQAAGAALMDGLKAGMQSKMGEVTAYAKTIADEIAKNKGPLPYDRKVLVPNGQALMEGLKEGLTTGFEPVLEKAKSMAEQISKAMEDGTSLTNLLGGKKFPELTQMLDELETQRKSMKVELDNTTDKGAKQALRDKMAQLQAQKDVLSLQKQELTNAQKYGGELSDQVGTTEEWASKFVDVGVNFARATGDQALSDLGIGGGAITGLGNALLDYGISMAKKGVTNIYTTSMDEALGAKQRLDNRAAMQWEK